MLRFVTFATLLAVSSAYQGYGGYGSGGYGGGYSSGGGSNYITGAVQSRRSVSYYDVPSTYSDASPVTIDLPSGVQPLNFVMRSRSSPINIQTVHEGQPGSYAETSSVDEPHVRVHNVQRSLIHRVNEFIQPYRQIRQQVLPLQENVEQVIARGSQGYGGNQGYGSYGGSSGSYGNNNYGYGAQTGSYYK